MADFLEKKVTIQGITIAFKIWNPEQEHRIICLHGKMDNAASFDLLAPLLPNKQLIAIDLPGNGLSSHYPAGVIPHWKNDAYLVLQLIKELNWTNFNIIAHSLGSLLATIIAIAKPMQVKKMVFLDILGPTINFIENSMSYLHRDIEVFSTYAQQSRTLFPDLDTAIRDRMRIGNISFQAAQALATRGMVLSSKGWHWTFDKRLRCVSSTLPHEDELQQMYNALETPVCLIRAQQGVPYPAPIFKERANAIKNLSIYEIAGGHHVHMDDPTLVAQIISDYLG